MGPKIFQTRSSSIPRLSHLELSPRINVPRDSTLWHRLQTLDFGAKSIALDLNHIIPQLALVDELHGRPHGWPNSLTPNVKLDHLKSLKVTCYPTDLRNLLLSFLE